MRSSTSSRLWLWSELCIHQQEGDKALVLRFPVYVVELAGISASTPLITNVNSNECTYRSGFIHVKTMHQSPRCLVERFKSLKFTKPQKATKRYLRGINNSIHSTNNLGSGNMLKSQIQLLCRLSNRSSPSTSRRVNK